MVDFPTSFSPIKTDKDSLNSTCDYCIPSCPLVRARRPLNAGNKSIECGEKSK